MAKWEYMIMDKNTIKKNQGDGAKIIEELNRLGEQGWELVIAFKLAGMKLAIKGILKRQKPGV